GPDSRLAPPRLASLRVHTFGKGTCVATGPDDAKAALLTATAARVRERAGDEAAVVERFVRAYYEHVAPEDLIGRSEVDLYGAALCHWNLARVKQPGEIKVNVYTPNV